MLKSHCSLGEYWQMFPTKGLVKKQEEITDDIWSRDNLVHPDLALLSKTSFVLGIKLQLRVGLPPLDYIQTTRYLPVQRSLFLHILIIELPAISLYLALSHLMVSSTLSFGSTSVHLVETMSLVFA